MTIKVIAKQEKGKRMNVFYLNSTEPKPQQLYMAIFDGITITTLTVYNLRTDKYEDVTGLFQPSFLNNLSEQLSNQLLSHEQAKAL